MVEVLFDVFFAGVGIRICLELALIRTLLARRDPQASALLDAMR